MKRLLIYSIAALTITGCARRILEDQLAVTALIPVSIDWSVSGVETESMHRATIMLFPLGGGAPLEYRLQENLMYKEIAVPQGVYSVLVFNETIDNDEFEGIKFINTDNYHLFAAVAVANPSKGWYTRSEDFPLIYNPEELAAWSLDYFEITEDTVIKTRKVAGKNQAQRSPALESIVPELTKVKPTPRYERLKVKANVTRLASSMQATATIDGTASGVYLVSGQKVVSTAAHAILLNGRVYDTDGKNGTTERIINIFGINPAPHRQILAIDFVLVDGTLKEPRDEFDVTDLINFLPNSIVSPHTIEVGVNDDNGDHLIELPNMDVTGTISVGDWDEIIVPIK